MKLRKQGWKKVASSSSLQERAREERKRHRKRRDGTGYSQPPKDTELRNKPDLASSRLQKQKVLTSQSAWAQTTGDDLLLPVRGDGRRRGQTQCPSSGLQMATATMARSQVPKANNLGPLAP